MNKFLEEDCRNYFSTTALAVLYFYLYGTPFIYQGQEIGMTNLAWKTIDEMDDVRAKGMYQEAIEKGEDPSKVLKYFGELGRDNARTPMQWENSENAGFTNRHSLDEGSTKTIPQSMQPTRNRILRPSFPFYQKVTRLRRDPKYQDTFAEGNFSPLYEDVPALIAYTRAKDLQTVSVIVNFKKQSQAVPLTSGTCILNNYGSLTEKDGQMLLAPYQAVVFASVPLD